MITPTPEDEAALEATKAPLLEHLVELRKRLVWSMLSFGLCFAGCFTVSTRIMDFLMKPMTAATNHLIYTGLYEVFFTQVKIAMFGGLCLGFPAIAWQLWLFVAPGLYKHEKRAFLPFLVWVPVLFAVGAAFVYFIILPFSIKFGGGYQVPSANGVVGIQLEAKVSEYLDLVMKLIIAFGITFQLPVILSLLAKIGIIKVKQLRDMRRYAWVALTAVAAVITPPDAISMISLMLPLVVLYEFSILCVWFIEKGRDRAEAARQTPEQPVG